MHVLFGATVLVVVGAAAVDGLVTFEARAREAIIPLAEGVDVARTVLLAQH